jgi:hypothetical protein
MLTHMHKVIHKVVGTFASSVGFGEETEMKKVTGSDRTLALGAPARPVSLGRGARDGLQRADAVHGAPARPVHGRATADAGHWTLRSVRCFGTCASGAIGVC